MKKVIIVAGKNEIDADRLRRRLKEQGYSSILCETLKDIIEKLRIFPACSVDVPLVLIDPGIYENTDDDLITQLSECAPEARFILLGQDNITFSVEDWLTGSMQHLTITGSELPEHIFRTQCTT